MRQIPTQKENPKGLHQRYYISKIVPNPDFGKISASVYSTPEFIEAPIDDDAEYFIMRLDEGGSDIEHIKACRIGVHALKAWKESAMSVMPDYQEIGKLLGVKLGESVHDKIIPAIKKLLAAQNPSIGEQIIYVPTKIEKELPNKFGWYVVVNPNSYPNRNEKVIAHFSSNYQWVNENGDGIHPSEWLKKTTLSEYLKELNK